MLQSIVVMQVCRAAGHQSGFAAKIPHDPQHLLKALSSGELVTISVGQVDESEGIGRSSLTAETRQHQRKESWSAVLSSDLC